MSGASDAAYGWVRKETAQLLPVPDIESNPPHGLDATIDEAIKGFLEKIGLFDELEKVTGMPSQLTEAAHQWTAQGKAMLAVADGLRSAATALPTAWEGDTSEAFGHGMGELVQAIEDTGKEMGETASILSRAAQECKLAEDTIIMIIREAIEWAAMTLAAMVITDILTLGLATLVDGLVAEAEVAVFVARVGKVSETLEKALKDLMEAVKGLKEAKGATGAAKGAWGAVKSANNFRKLGGILGNPLKGWGKLAGIAVGDEFKKHVIAPVMGATTGLPEVSLTDPVKDAGGLLLNSSDRSEQPPAPAPYRVNQRSIEEDFG
ncbi:WXG100 family type VII secretion target [Streptomyces sp. NBC_01465]|uniref:WXG100 family type VII secretion target n=1 Tax=Streptomyces sp. NBC_01465 TaxID=2903878 RepID=UPI002E331DF1|nr:WXG100 family type VII secretion target [Streptomyces sp. NBC_01465]